MRVTGQNTVAAPAQQVWDALLDPAVLVGTIPGCERLEETGPHTYAMTVSAGVAAIRGTYDGTCSLSDLVEPSSLVMRVEGAGAPGTIAATVTVDLAESPAGTTLSYDADAVVGGMVAGVGQRMLAGVARRMAEEFLANIERAVVAPAAEQAAQVVTEAASSKSAAAVFTAPAADRAAVPVDQRAFLAGVGIGAGLVLLGVLAGARLRR
jgi:carbon monoxide dehydrogenase subunit G